MMLPKDDDNTESAGSRTQKKLDIAATATVLFVALFVLLGNSARSINLPSADSSSDFERHLRKQTDESNLLLEEIDDVAVVTSDDAEASPLLESAEERSLMIHDKNFSPLTCNAGVDWNVACAPESATTLSTLKSTTAPGSRAEVPCGQCVIVDYTDGSTVTLPDGINVIGKLHFPSSANVIIRTTHVIVQGIFSTDQATGALSPDDLTTENVFESASRKLQSAMRKVKIYLYEETTEDIFFQPHDENLNACGGDLNNPCEVKIGRKAFAVAGGLLDVSAIDPNCPAWEHLLDYTVVLNHDSQTNGGCSPVLLDMNFKVGDTYNNRFGGSMTVEPMDSISGNAVGDNAYISHKRNARHEGPKFTVETTCIISDTNYRISGRARLRSKDGITPTLCSVEGGNGGYCLEFKILDRDSGYPFLGRQDFAEHTNINDGEWFEFSFLLNTIPESLISKSNIDFWFWRPEANAIIDIDWLKIHDEGAEIHKIKVSSEAATYWGVGSEILLTSSTYNQDDAHKFTVTGTDPTKGLITINRAIPFTTSKLQDSRFPVEVASITRNFIIEGENNGLHGGHMIILHTPDIEQKIEGIEFRSLGQQGSMGRYPLHFHMSASVDGSKVIKNVIKESNQRGVVIHGTHNLTVSDNVIYNIKGHGYFLEDGVEQFNRFSGNLATGIRPVTTLLSSTDTDGQPSCFWMSNTMNYWEGNVCAGSSSHGFWIEPQHGPARGASKDLVDATFDRTKLNLLQFQNNDVHSVNSFGMRLYPNKWTPPEEAQIDNLRAYRNGWNGISLHVDTNVRLVNGVYADNGHRQIWSNLADDIRLQGVEVIGLRPETKASLNRAGQSPKCQSGYLHGVTFSTTRQFGEESSTGMFFEGVSFKGFDCGNDSHAIHAGDEQSRNKDNLYDAITTLNGVLFEDAPLKVSACSVQTQGVDYLSFEDAKGDLNPTNKGTPGFLVSNTELAKGLAGGSCVDLDSNTCLSYCENACLQRVTVTSDSAPDVMMKITDESGTTQSVSSHMEGAATYTLTIARFAASLPAGTFDISFEAADGTAVAMPYTTVKMEEEPICAKGSTIVNTATLSPSDAACTSDLLKNGDFESGIDGWKQLFTGLTHAVGEGVNGSNAIKTTDRKVWNSMITKYIDPNCLVAGADYDVKLSYKIVDENNNPVDCGSSCPSLSFAYYPNGAQRWMFVSGTTMPFKVGEWNTIESRFSFSDAVINSGRIHAAIYDGNQVFSGQLIVDDFTLIKV